MTRFSALDSGEFSILAGTINGSQGTDAVLTSGDGAATLTATGSGVQTVTFGAGFNSSPIISATILDAALDTDALHGVTITSIATDAEGLYSAVTFTTTTTTTNATATDILTAAADLDFHFTVMGPRNR